MDRCHPGHNCWFPRMAHIGGDFILARRKFVLDREGEALRELLMGAGG
ncbi:MAG: hypothetical protein ACXWLR_11210 [Myxococcales bacterium]